MWTRRPYKRRDIFFFFFFVSFSRQRSIYLRILLPRGQTERFAAKYRECIISRAVPFSFPFRFPFPPRAPSPLSLFNCIHTDAESPVLFPARQSVSAYAGVAYSLPCGDFDYLNYAIRVSPNLTIRRRRIWLRAPSHVSSENADRYSRLYEYSKWINIIEE